MNTIKVQIEFVLLFGFLIWFCERPTNGVHVPFPVRYLFDRFALNLKIVVKECIHNDANGDDDKTETMPKEHAKWAFLTLVRLFLLLTNSKKAGLFWLYFAVYLNSIIVYTGSFISTDRFARLDSFKSFSNCIVRCAILTSGLNSLPPHPAKIVLLAFLLFRRTAAKRVRKTAQQK